ncbi:MAG: hypothetical protein R3F51_20390 [Cyanobacteriota/Melainabacteria group bacterium]
MIFEADMEEEPHNELREAVVEACVWIVKKPKEKTYPNFETFEGAS